MTRARRIKRAEVQRLALCKRGKNGLRTLYKSDGTAEFASLVKADEQGQLLSVMWPKGLADADGDFADSDTAIESMMSSLIANGGQLDIEHDGEVLTRDQARVTEVFRIQDHDPRFANWQDYDGNVVDVSGGAAVAIQIDDPALRKSFRDGEWDGVSLFGPAAVEEVDLKAASERVAARMGGGTNDMTKEELQAAFASFKGEVAEMIKSAATASVEPKAADQADQAADQAADQVADQAPVFDGDPANADDLEQYEKALRAHEIRKAIASGTMTADQIAEMRKSLAEKVPSVEQLKEAGIDASPEDSAELRKAQLQVFKLQKSSRVPARFDEGGDEEEQLEKSRLDLASEIAGIANRRISGAGNGAANMKVVRG
jgi:hypothetical protein